MTATNFGKVVKDSLARINGIFDCHIRAFGPPDLALCKGDGMNDFDDAYEYQVDNAYCRGDIKGRDFVVSLDVTTTTRGYFEVSGWAEEPDCTFVPNPDLTECEVTCIYAGEFDEDGNEIWFSEDFVLNNDHKDPVGELIEAIKARVGA